MGFFRSIFNFLLGKKDVPTLIPTQNTKTLTQLSQKTLPARPIVPPLIPRQQTSDLGFVSSSPRAPIFTIPDSVLLQKLQNPEIQLSIKEKIASICSPPPTSDQWKMILEPSASVRVVAGAGSGKSTTLILRLLVFHKVLGIPLNQMRVFSFTRASVKEFQEKLADKLELWESKVEGKDISDEYRNELKDRAETVVSTFHSVLTKLRSTVMPEASNSKLFDLLSDANSKDEREELDPLLNTRFSIPQSRVLTITHERAFLNSKRYREVICEIVEDQQKKEWQKFNNRNPQSESIVYFWNRMRSDEKKYHGYANDVFNPAPAFPDGIESLHVDPFRAAVADRLRELGLQFAPLAPFPITAPVQGWPQGTLYAAFRIGNIFLHIDRKIDKIEQRAMYYHQFDRRKLINIYCPTLDQHKILSYKDFEEKGDRCILSANADLLLQQWIGLQDLAANPNTAPVISIQLPGDIKKQQIAHVLCQEGDFIERMGLEVLNLPKFNGEHKLINQVSELLHIFWPYFEQVLQENQLFRFHDLIVRLRKLNILKEITSRTRFMSNLFIDEFQDISPEIVDWLCKILQTQAADTNISVTSVGDDFQSIYGWRGSSPTFLMNYNSCFPAQRIGTVKLSDNFRSRQSIIDAAEVVLKPVTQKIDKHGLSHISSLDNMLPYPIAMVKSMGWSEAHNLELTANESKPINSVIWEVFCKHIIEILKAVHDGGHTEKILRGRTKLEIFVLSRSNEGLKKVPREKSLQSTVIESLAIAKIGTFLEISVRRSTFHRSKGLEADFVLLLEDTLPPEQNLFRDFVYKQASLPGTYTKMQEEEA
jgi:superfamily I DNA/RNA helicase